MKPIRKKNFKEAIIEIKTLDDGSLLVVDSKTTVRYLDKENFDLINGYKAKINHLRYKTKVVAFSSDGSYFTSISADSKETVLYNAKTRKAISKVSRHQGEVSCVGIDPKNRYMFSCGEDGKTFVTDMKSGKLAFTIPAHADTINDIAFSDNAQWVVICSYDKKITIFNLAMMNVKHKIKAHASAVMKLKFLSKHRLFSIDKHNRAIIWDIYTAKVLHRVQGIHDTLTQIVSGSDDKFLFIGTALGYVLVYDLDTYELIDKKYIKLSSGISSMIFNEETQELIIGTQEGDLLEYHIYEGEVALKELLKKRELDTIEKCVEQNPLLEYTEIYKYMATLWDKTLEKAKIYLEKNDRATAIKLFEIFINIPAKKSIIKKTLSEYDEFEKFIKLINDGKIALAYGVVAQHPIYKDSKVYKDLELRWQKTFMLAQKYALEPRGLEKAREILTPFRGVSNKTALMQEMYTQSKAYDRFKLALGKKDFRIALDLVKMHPFIKEFPEYAKIMAYGDSLHKKSKVLIKKDDLDLALKMLAILSDFQDYKDVTKTLIAEIKDKQKFNNAIAKDNLVLAYALLDQSDDLLETPKGKELNNEWNYVLAKANSFAVKGDVEGIKESFEKYIKIESKFIAIATTFAWCYMIQLENAIKKKQKQELIEDGIRHYVSLFGYQDDIDSFLNIFKSYYKESRLNLEFDPKGSLSMWNPSMIVNSILE